MNKDVNYEIHLINRPVRLPSESDFKLVETPVPKPGDGEILVENKYLSVDPYMRGRMTGNPSYIGAYQLNKVLDGGCVGQVTKSLNEKFQVGDYVSGMLGWRKYFTSDGEGLFKIDPNMAPIQAYLGMLGMPGFTAYFGLLEIGQLKEGDNVFVSAASGAVGSIVCQIAKIKNCKVIGSAGSDEKVNWLKDEIGIDACFNYKKVTNLSKELRSVCPDGIDVYFDNVGGDHLEAALLNMNTFGRIVSCGMISQYNLTEFKGVNYLSTMIVSRLTMRGFIISDHYDLLGNFQNSMSKWLSEGKIRGKETIIEGIENTPQAFIGLFTGKNIGKMIVKV